jgi:hypothetical protein
MDIEGYEDWTRGTGDPVAFPGSYQSSPGEQTAPAEKVLIDTPTHLIRSVTEFLRSGEDVDIQTFLPESSLIEDKLRLSESGAVQRVEAIRRSLQELREDIHPQAEPEFRRSNWNTLLQITQIELGPPRAVDGSIVDPGEAHMYDTNRVSLHLVGTDVDFLIRFPRVFRGDDNNWYLGSPPVSSSTYDLLLTFGIDQKAELMRSNQSGFPFRKGNYWDYRIEKQRDGEWVEQRGKGFRDIVDDIEDHELYRIITIRRTFRSPDERDERRVYLQTPTRIFPCDRSCRRATGSLQNLLGRLRTRDPIMVFPLRRLTDERNSNDGDAPPSTELETSYTVPYGVFDGVFKLHRNGTERQPDLFVRSGTGILAYHWREAGENYRAALRAMRILR